MVKVLRLFFHSKSSKLTHEPDKNASFREPKPMTNIFGDPIAVPGVGDSGPTPGTPFPGLGNAITTLKYFLCPV